MRTLFVLILYRSFWFSLLSFLSVIGKKHKQDIIPVRLQRLMAIFVSIWLALPVTVPMNVHYKVENGFQKEQAVKVLNSISKLPNSSPSVPLQSIRFRFLDAATVIWLLGTAVVFFFHIGVYICTSRNLYRWKTGRILEDSYKNVRILYSLSVDVPLTEGLLHPIIWLPDSWKQKDSTYALLHETTHIKQGDLWVKWLLLWVKSVYWFHPFIFRFARFVSETLEYACDENVVKNASLEMRRQYSLSILEASSQNKYQRFSDGFLGLVEEKNQMVSRIERIMNPKPTDSITFKLKLGLCFLSFLVTGSLVRVEVRAESQSMPVAIKIVNRESDNKTEINEENEYQQMEISEPNEPIKKTDNAKSVQADAPETQEEQPVEFNLEVYPCEAYRVAFPLWYETSPEAVKKDLMFYANPGTEVQAISDEIVIETGKMFIYGKYIITENNGYQIRYSHLQEITVNVGDELKQGSTMGIVGVTGDVKHYMCELRVQSKEGNPADLSTYGKGYEW